MQFYIVTGGISDDKDLVTTEILKKEGGSSWQTAASLPSSSLRVSGVSLPNGHFMVSGDDCLLFNIYLSNGLSCCIITGGLLRVKHLQLRPSFTDVLDYDPDADKWTKVGEMAQGRHHHAMSLVPKETADYCV